MEAWSRGRRPDPARATASAFALKPTRSAASRAGREDILRVRPRADSSCESWQAACRRRDGHGGGRAHAMVQRGGWAATATALSLALLHRGVCLGCIVDGRWDEGGGVFCKPGLADDAYVVRAGRNARHTAKARFAACERQAPSLATALSAPPDPRLETLANSAASSAHVKHQDTTLELASLHSPDVPMATGYGMVVPSTRCDAVQCSKIRRAAARLPDHPVVTAAIAVTAVTAHHRAQNRQSQGMVTRCAERHGRTCLT
jgi:hypothetical protein